MLTYVIVGLGAVGVGFVIGALVYRNNKDMAEDAAKAARDAANRLRK